MRYGTSKAPDPQEWFELDEPERLDLVKRYQYGQTTYRREREGSKRTKSHTSTIAQ